MSAAELWRFDDSVPYDPSVLQGVCIPKDLEEAFEDVFNGEAPVRAAA